MCYYNGQRVTRTEYIRLKQIEKETAKYEFLNQHIHNGFNYGQIAVLKANAEKSNFDIVQMEWGLLPTYLKDREAVNKFRNGYKNEQGRWINGFTTLNAKGENLFTNEQGTGVSMFKEAARYRRCLVLSTGIFEWRHIHRLNKKTGLPLKTADKYPYYISLKEQEYFYMAGIYQEWADKTTGEVVDTVSIVTAPANALMDIIHNSKHRMPTILSDELAYEWMMTDLSDERITEIALTQFPSKLMEACTIDKDFRSSEEPSAPFEYAEEDVPSFETNFADR